MPKLPDSECIDRIQAAIGQIVKDGASSAQAEGALLQALITTVRTSNRGRSSLQAAIEVLSNAAERL